MIKSLMKKVVYQISWCDGFLGRDTTVGIFPIILSSYGHDVTNGWSRHTNH